MVLVDVNYHLVHYCTEDDDYEDEPEWCRLHLTSDPIFVFPVPSPYFWTF